MAPPEARRTDDTPMAELIVVQPEPAAIDPAPRPDDPAEHEAPPPPPLDPPAETAVTEPPPIEPPAPEPPVLSEAAPLPADAASVQTIVETPPPRPVKASVTPPMVSHPPRPAAPARHPAAAQPVNDPGPAAPASRTEPVSRASEDVLRAGIHAAVQAAVRCPAAASMMRLSGRAGIAFDYRDGVVAAVELRQTAASAMLDQAALAAVRSAHYPPPPGDEAGHTLHLLIWVEEACAG